MTKMGWTTQNKIDAIVDHTRKGGGEIELSEEAQGNFNVSVDAVKEFLVACKGLDGSLA